MENSRRGAGNSPRSALLQAVRFVWQRSSRLPAVTAQPYASPASERRPWSLVSPAGRALMPASSIRCIGRAHRRCRHLIRAAAAADAAAAAAAHLPFLPPPPCSTQGLPAAESCSLPHSAGQSAGQGSHSSHGAGRQPHPQHVGLPVLPLHEFCHALAPPPPAPSLQFLESERASAKGHKLFTLTVLPDGPPAACLCWHHGVAEHIGRYKQGGWVVSFLLLGGVQPGLGCRVCDTYAARMPRMLQDLFPPSSAHAQCLSALRRRALQSTLATLWGTARARGTARSSSRTQTL